MRMYAPFNRSLHLEVPPVYVSPGQSACKTGIPSAINIATADAMLKVGLGGDGATLPLPRSVLQLLAQSQIANSKDRQSIPAQPVSRGN